MKLESPKRSAWENILLVVVFAAILIFMVSSYYKEQRSYKTRQLYYELTLLRQGINQYFIINKRYPNGLIELGSGTYKFPGDDRNHRYVENFPISRDGRVLDPFGNPYVYDADRGMVMSATPGHTFW